MEISDDSRCFKDGGTFREISNFIWRPYSKFGKIFTTLQKTWMALRRQCFHKYLPQMGHILKDCPNAGTKTCYKCGGIGHILKDCPSRGWMKGEKDIFSFLKSVFWYYITLLLQQVWKEAKWSVCWSSFIVSGRLLWWNSVAEKLLVETICFSSL